MREIRLGVIDHTAQGLEHAPLTVDNTRHTPIDGKSSQITTPGEAHPFEIALKGTGEQGTWLCDGDGHGLA